MKKIIGLAFLSLVFFQLVNACDMDKSKEENKNTYQNPVVPKSLPDPTIIRAEDGFFYLFATEDIRHTPIYKSNDLVNWEFVGTAFTAETRPNFEPKGGLWAPDINYINGQYVLYYSMSVWGGEWTCGIGIATSESPAGPFTDQGKLFRSNEIDVQNSIDPFFITENGKNYLFWGSFRGIYYIELTKDGLAILPGAEKQRIAGTAYEGVFIMKNEGYYYMFASIGSCCEGVNSTYTTVVGRADNLFGPYLNKIGQEMISNRHENIIRGNDRFVGTGHNSEVVSDDSGKQWIIYHAVDKLNPKGRVLMMDELQWKDGWPFVNDGTPSLEWERPTFK